MQNSSLTCYICLLGVVGLSFLKHFSIFTIYLPPFSDRRGLPHNAFLYIYCLFLLRYPTLLSAHIKPFFCLFAWVSLNSTIPGLFTQLLDFVLVSQPGSLSLKLGGPLCKFYLIFLVSCHLRDTTSLILSYSLFRF